MAVSAAAGLPANLGHYHVLEQIGHGGMGVVYKARDTHLDRFVALKVLPPELIGDSDRRRRFVQEAKAASALNHSSIITVYDIGSANGVDYMAMEYVPGMTLEQAIGRRGLPLQEAITISIQITDALAKAHAAGIVHRDLKPSNVMLTAERQAKILDFGLAKLTEQAADPVKTAATQDTLSAPGRVVGTAAYMAPEQARGEVVDKRADVWAFGCVLYEMLTGHRAFPGNTASESIASVLAREPDWSTLPASATRKVRDLLQRCLRKDPRQRLHDLADARIELEEALHEPAERVLTGTAPPARRWLPFTLIAAALLLGAVAGVFVWRARHPEHAPVVSRTTVSLTSLGMRLTEGALAISPDGQTLVFSAEREGQAQLYLRHISEWQPRPLPGTEQAGTPFFSPDGEWIGFTGNMGLQKISVRGGLPQPITGDKDFWGTPLWLPDGRIIYGLYARPGLWSVSADGGAPVQLVKPSGPARLAWYGSPQLLPNGETLIFNILRDGKHSVAALVIKTGEPRTLVESGGEGRYVSAGFLLYVSEGRLYAVAFDPDRLEKRGTPRVVVDDIGNLGRYDISRNGTLAYISNSAPPGRLVWKDRSGSTMPLKFKPGTYRWPSLSPDGRTFVVGMQDGLVRNLWTGQVDGEPLTRLTFGNDDVFTLFSPDGKWIYFTSGRNGRYNIFRTRADGSGDAERVTDSPNAHRATSFSPDGRVLLFNEIDQSGNCDIMQIDDSGTIKPFVKTQFSELQGVFSPDGRWVAYASNESGRWQVYIQPYPGPGARRQISVDFGQLPLWSPKGDELFFQGAAAVMAVRILNGSPDGTPHPLFPHSGVAAGGKGVMWNASITRDGQRFLMVDSADPSSAPTQISVIFNWFEELKTSTTDGKP